MFGDLLRTATHALELIAERTAEVDWPLAALGVVLYFAAQAVRTRGWHAIVRAAYPAATGLKARHTMAAYLAGAGLNGVIPARGGDIVKLWLLHRRIPQSRYATLASTFVPESLFETLFGTALVLWALAYGFLPVPMSVGELPHVDVSLVIRHPVLSAVVAGGVALLAVVLVRLARRYARGLLDGVRQGLVILRHPRQFVVHVASWQALARLVRLGSLAAFMGAFALPVTPETVVLVMAAQGGGRIIPIAPASAGLRLAMLSYGFVEITDTAVDIASITAFTVGVGVLLMLVGLVVSVVMLGLELGTWSPRAALAAARQAARERHLPGTKAGSPT